MLITPMLLIEEGQDYEDVNEASLPYTLLRNLGHGHSGNVEEVRDEISKAVFARKTIRVPAARLSKQERTKVFQNEIKIIRSLERHHHIISVFATYATKRHFGLILQPVASDGDLEDFFAEYWSIAGDTGEMIVESPRLEAMRCVMEKAFGCLAVGLAFIHEKRIRHKDIKPRNILVHNGLVLYTDFGYSFDSTGFSRSTTEGRPSFLTRKYSAPEVLEHEKRNSKADIYSLGCVFIELHFALLLFSGLEEEVDCYSRSMSDIHENFKDLPSSSQYSRLEDIIMNMTMRDSSKRPSATHVSLKLLSMPNFFCEKCRLASRYPPQILNGTEGSRFWDTTLEKPGSRTPEHLPTNKVSESPERTIVDLCKTEEGKHNEDNGRNVLRHGNDVARNGGDDAPRGSSESPDVNGRLIGEVDSPANISPYKRQVRRSEVDGMEIYDDPDIMFQCSTQFDTWNCLLSPNPNFEIADLGGPAEIVDITKDATKAYCVGEWTWSAPHQDYYSTKHKRILSEYI